jgi:hypothetical protein
MSAATVKKVGGFSVRPMTAQEAAASLKIQKSMTPVYPFGQKSAFGENFAKDKRADSKSADLLSLVLSSSEFVATFEKNCMERKVTINAMSIPEAPHLWYAYTFGNPRLCQCPETAVLGFTRDQLAKVVIFIAKHRPKQPLRLLRPVSFNNQKQIHTFDKPEISYPWIFSPYTEHLMAHCPGFQQIHEISFSQIKTKK